MGGTEVGGTAVGGTRVGFGWEGGRSVAVNVRVGTNIFRVGEVVGVIVGVKVGEAVCVRVGVLVNEAVGVRVGVRDGEKTIKVTVGESVGFT